MKKRTTPIFGRALPKAAMAWLLALALLLGMFPAVTASAASPDPAAAAGYVSDNLVLWLDANNNTGTGTHDGSATQWVNLANTSQTVDVSSFTWGEDSEHGANYLNLSDGWIILPDEVRQAIGSSEFTIEFLMEDYDGSPHASIRNIMNVTGDDAWLASLTGAVATPNDNFVLFMNQSGGNNNGKFCFRTCYTNSSNGWSKVNSSGNDYCKVTGTEISGVTNTLTFKSGGSSYWYLDGVQTGSATNSSKTIDVSGFRTSPGTASTWQTTRLPQVTFGTDNDVIASRAPFSAKVKAIRVYKSELTAAEAAQNAAADQERYYSIPNNEVPSGYVQSGLVLFLDAINNTGSGHSAAATTWTNLADTTQAVSLPASTVGTGTWYDDYLDMSGYIKLPESVRQTIATGNWTIEFLMDSYAGDPANTTSNVYNIFCLTGDDEWIATSGKGSTPNDYFVMYQHNKEKSDTNMVRFKIHNGSKEVVNSRADVSCTTINGATQSIAFDSASNLIWYQDGAAVVTKTSNGATAKVDGFNAGSGYQTDRLPQVIFGAAVDKVSTRAFSTHVKAIRIYNRTLSAAEVAQNAEMDAARYMTADKLTELAADSWANVITGNPSATTAAGLQAFAQGKLSAAAAEHLNVSVTDNADGTFTFTYTSKNNLSGYTAQSYTLFVNADYAVDFSTLSADGQAKFLHDVYAHQGAGGVTVTIEDGKLVYKPKSGGRPVSGLYLPVYYSTNEYVWEMEVTYNGKVGGYTWAGQLFGVKAVDTDQNTCTFNLGGSGAAAYEFCKRTQPNLWANHVTTTLSASNFGEGKLDAAKFNENYSAKDGQTFKLKYVVKDGMAFGFIDGVLVVESTNLGTDFSGGFGVNSAGPILEIKSIKISTDVSGESVASPIGYYDVDIYEPETAITVAPTVMQMADSSLYDVSDLAKRPASVIFTVKAENGVLNAYDGSTLLGTFEELYAANAGKALVGVRIADQAAADLISAYCESTKNQNLWVFAADGAVLKTINEDHVRVRGVVDLTGSDISSIVDDDNARTQIYDKVYGYGHRTVLISAANATEDVIRELQSMKIITLVEAYDLTDAQLYDLVVFGPNGILTDDYAAAITMLESFDDYTLVRPAAVVGHRGDRTYPDNSLEAIVSAAQSGAAAAEFDVIATLDGYLVLSHDNDNYEAVDYRSGAWGGVAITNAYWKKANAEAAGRPNDYFEGRYFHTSTSQTAVPYITLDQLFDATGTQYPALTYHIEVKDTQNDTVNGGKLVVNLIDSLLRSDKYSYLRGRCDILCFSTSINYPSTEKGYAVHNQSSITASGLPLATAIYNYENFYRPINSLLEPGSSIVSVDYLEAIKHYGMTCYPWTFNNNGLYQAYIAGYHGFTTDYPHVSDGIYRKLTASVDGEGNVTVLAYTLADHLGAAPVDVTTGAELFAITEKDNVVIDGSTVSVSAGVTADIGVRYKVELSSASGSQKWFYLYGGSFRVESAAAPADPVISAAEGCTLTYGYTEGSISVTVSPIEGHTLSYQWYDGDGAPITGATAATYTIPTGKDAGAYSYYCVVTATRTDNGQTAMATSSTVTVTVNPKPVAEPTVKGSYVYTGSEQTVELEGVEDYMTIVSGTKGTSAGDYEVVITLDNNYKWAEGSDGKVQWAIGKAQAVITVDTTPIVVTYGETVVLPEATTNFGTVTCDKTAADLVNAGTYTVTYTVAGSDNWNGTTETVTVTVKQKPVAEPTVKGAYTYTGAEQTVELEGVEAFMMVSGNKGTDAGNYEVVITLGGNYKWAEGSDGKVQWSIGKKAAHIAVIDKLVMISFPAPDLSAPVAGKDYTVTGLVAGDSVDTVILTCSPDMYRAGAYAIRVEAEDINYTFTYTHGKLVVTAGSHDPAAGGSGSAPGGGAVICNCHRFSDVNVNLWYHPAVCYAVNRGIMNGTGNGSTFSPYLNLSRAMMMTMLARLDGVNTDGGATWYEKGMKWAVENGISDGTNPNADITREQMVTMLYRYAGSPAVVGNYLAGFPDGDEVSSWAKDTMNWAIATGVIQGKGDGTLDPQGTATRAEVAQILYNYLNK